MTRSVLILKDLKTGRLNLFDGFEARVEAVLFRLLVDALAEAVPVIAGDS